MLHWLLHTDGGLFVRIAVGCAIFASLAIIDLRKHGQAATRWREYGVLLVAVAAAIVYGAINDQITSTISWEYFYYGKELNHILGDTTPPDMTWLRWEASKVGIRATWTAGLLFGVVLLIANNPWRDLPRLPFSELVRKLPIILLTVAIMGAIFGTLGYFGALKHVAADFEEMWQANYYRPRRFMCTWGIHLGGYFGGFLGTLIAAIGIIRKRVRLRAAINPAH